MNLMNRPIVTRPKAWLLLAATLFLATILLAACSGGDQVLLAEFNRDGEAEIFLTGLGDDESDWQSLAEDVRPTNLFPSSYATFVPDTNRIALWYEDGGDIVVQHMKIGDDKPTTIFDGDKDNFITGSMLDDPFAIFIKESPQYDRCYVSLDGAEAERLTRKSFCSFSENGVVAYEIDDNGETTITVVSLDGKDETVILDGVEDIASDVRWNDALTTFVYAEQNRRDEQLIIIEAGDEEGEELGDGFASIDAVGFLPDGKTVYAIAKVDEDDDEVGLYINGTGDPLLEDDSIRMSGQSEDGDHTLFITRNDREAAAFVYSVDDQTVTEVTENDRVSSLGFVNKDRLLLGVEDNDDFIIMSAKADGTESVELFSDDKYDINFSFLDSETERLFVIMSDEDGLRSLFVTGLEEEDGYFLLEEWSTFILLNVSNEVVVFSGQEDEGDDWALYSIPLEPDAREVELDDDAEGGFRGVFFSKNGRSLLYTARQDQFVDFEVRQVPVDGSENPERLYKDVWLLDVSWDGQSNLEFLR
jgi:hypothetical protein